MNKKSIFSTVSVRAMLLSAMIIGAAVLTAIQPVSAIWFFKPGYADYVPFGVPDFDQRQDAWTDPMTGRWSWCGPVAVANSLWWLDSEYEPSPIPPPIVNDFFPLVTSYGVWDDHDPQNVQPSVQDLAWQMDTDGMRTGSLHSGTNIVDMFEGIQNYLVDRDLWGRFYAKMVKMPSFEFINSEVMQCEDSILLLGFWQEQPPGSGIWVRVGGHYVTVPGIDFENSMIAFCDPIADNAEPPPQGGNGPGWVVPPPPHPHPPVPPDTIHNDAAFFCYDFYGVFVGSPSPGGPQLGVSYEPYYQYDIFNNMQGQNCPDEFKAMEGPYNPAWPVWTEVEYGVFVSPGPWFLKSPYPDYAPCGMPDFAQRQDGWVHPHDGWTWCGPVSVADSLWWYDSKYESILNPTPVPPPVISDSFMLVESYNLGVWDDHDARNLLPLVNDLAFLMDTDGIRTGLYHSGTWFIDMETGISQYLQKQGINPKGDCDGDGDVDNDDMDIVRAAFNSQPGDPNWNMAADVVIDNDVDIKDISQVAKNYGKTGLFYEKTVEFPSFAYIGDEVYRCEDVELCVEFWHQIDAYTWERYVMDPGGIGGHYVTCSGVNSSTSELLLSDPWQDAFESGATSGMSPVYHSYPHLSGTHNDTTCVSYDAYSTVTLPPDPTRPYPGVSLLEIAGYLQTMGFDPSWHAFIRATIATSPLQAAIADVHTMKRNCVPLPTVCRTMPMGVYVKVRNPDFLPHSFDVAAYANSTWFETHAVTLDPGQETTVVFTWSTVGYVEYSNWTFSASIEGVSGNKFASAEKAVMVVHMGDITGDGKVEIADQARVTGGCWSIRVSDPNNVNYGLYMHPTPCPTCPHQPNCDVTGDGSVQAVGDVNRVSGNFGWHR